MKPAVRYPLGCAAVAVAIIVIVAGTAAWQVREVGARTVSNVLATAQSIQTRIAAQRQQELALKVRLLAGDAGFVSYIEHALTAGAEDGASVDHASIRDLVEERRATYGLEDAVILDALGTRVIASGPDYLDPRDIAAAPLVVSVRSTLRPACGWNTYTNKSLLVCVAPLVRGTTMQALLLTASPVGAPTAKELAEAGGTDVALVALAASGPRLAASTLESPLAQQLLAQITQDASLLKGVLQNGGTSRKIDFNVAGASWPAQMRPLAGATDDVVLVSLLAPSARAATYDAVVVPAAAGGLLLLVLLLMGAFVEWRRVRDPLARLIDLVERAVQGDTYLELRTVGDGPAARLASAFNRLLAKENRDRPSKRESGSAR
ncbi:MAG: hypothetical protein ABIW82_02520 [Dokdonella sp.]